MESVVKQQKQRMKKERAGPNRRPVGISVRYFEGHVTGTSRCLTEVTAAECVKLNSASFGVEVRDVHVRLMLGENLRTVPTGRVEKETVSTVHPPIFQRFKRRSS